MCFIQKSKQQTRNCPRTSFATLQLRATIYFNQSRRPREVLIKKCTLQVRLYAFERLRRVTRSRALSPRQNSQATPFDREVAHSFCPHEPLGQQIWCYHGFTNMNCMQVEGGWSACAVRQNGQLEKNTPSYCPLRLRLLLRDMLRAERTGWKVADITECRESDSRIAAAT